MAARSIASLSLTFGLVSVPVRLYSATESSSAIRFRLMARGGARVRQTYVADALPSPPVIALEEPEAARPVSATRSASKRVFDFPTAQNEAPATAPPAPEIELEAPVARSEMVKGYEFERDSSSSSRTRS